MKPQVHADIRGKNKKWEKLVYPALIISCIFFAALNSFGASATETLLKNLGAVAGGLGNAYSAVSDNTDIIYYNPAGFSELNRMEFSLKYQPGLDSDRFSMMAVGYPMGLGTFGFSSVFYDKTDIQRDRINILSYGKRISEKVDIGGSIKTVNSELLADAAIAGGTCFDIGALYNLASPEGGKSRSRLALSVQNLGSGMDYGIKNDAFVNIVRFGWLSRATVSHWSGNTYDTTTEIDLVKQGASNNVELDLGFGFEFTRYFTLRMGFCFLSGDYIGNLGLGLSLPYGKDYEIHIDFVSITTRTDTLYRIAAGTSL